MPEPTGGAVSEPFSPATFGPRVSRDVQAFLAGDFPGSDRGK